MPPENNQKTRGFLIFSGGMEKNVLAMRTHFPQISNVLVVRILLIFLEQGKLVLIAETHSKPTQTYKTDLLTITVNAFQTLNISEKTFFDIRLGCDTFLIFSFFLSFFFFAIIHTA